MIWKLQMKQDEVLLLIYSGVSLMALFDKIQTLLSKFACRHLIQYNTVPFLQAIK